MRRAGWARSAWAKALALVLASLTVPVLVCCAAAFFEAYDNNWWTQGTVDLWESDLMRSAVYRQAAQVRSYYAVNGAERLEDLWLADTNRTNYRFALYNEGGVRVFSNIQDGDVTRSVWDVDSNAAAGSVWYEYDQFQDTGWEIAPSSGGTGQELHQGRIESAVSAEWTAQDGIYWAWRLVVRLYEISRHLVPLTAATSALLLALVIYLACVSGRRAGQEEIVPGWQEKIPLDLYLCGDFLLECLIATVLWEPGFYEFELIPLTVTLWLLLSFCGAIAVLAAWMTVCTRVKQGKWWRNTVVFLALRACWRVLRATGRFLRSGFRAIPLVWRTALLLLGLSLLELWGLLATQYDTDLRLLLWFLEKLVIVPLALYIAVMLRRLQRAGEALSAGELDAGVNTRRLVWDFRRHGENLNAISVGLAAAVEKQLKSERLKTELITNVSHDIKTPLTSIINYVDLLRRDGAGEHAGEYLEVLDRQSRKLKKLTEDLVELSKASTGNVAVNAGRTGVGELLLQALGEYSERLDRARLEAVLTLHESAPDGLRETSRGQASGVGGPVAAAGGSMPGLFAWADGTLMWRVLDNLFSNACKYAQPGTRFYVDAHRREDRIALAFKNVSRERLNVPAEELMERFVRGDSARGGEGSGLGLNIARSLTELQGGTFRLSVDGDLFKVELTLPASP